jgi:hypothetical protein
MLDDSKHADPSTGFKRKVYQNDGETLRRTAAQIATELLGLNADTPRTEVAWWWDVFAQALASQCHPKGSVPQNVLAAVQGEYISWEAVTAEEFTFERFLRSEEIDLDHLSGPLPRLKQEPENT